MLTLCMVLAGAGEAWFHLMQLLLPSERGSAASDEGHLERLAAALNDFVQASTLGQLAQRLQLLHTFRCGLCLETALCFVPAVSTYG